MTDLRAAVARVLHGPRKLAFVRQGDQLVLAPDPSGARLGFLANLPWWLRPRPKPLTMILIDELPGWVTSYAGHPPEMGSGKSNALWGTLAELQRIGRKSGIAEWAPDQGGAAGLLQWMPPRPEKTLRATRYQPDGCRVTDSVPVLQAMVDTWELRGRPPWPHAREWGPVGSDEHYTAQISTDYGRLTDLLDTARWRVEVESRRWLAQHPTDGYDDETWWYVFLGVLALRWTLNQRRGAPEGFLPSREVALRDPGRMSTS